MTATRTGTMEPESVAAGDIEEAIWEYATEVAQRIATRARTGVEPYHVMRLPAVEARSRAAISSWKDLSV